MTVLSDDIKNMKTKEGANLGAMLSIAAKESGRSPWSIGLDFRKLRKKQGKLRFYEYLLYGLFDKEKWSDAEREAFISGHIHWPIVNTCNNTEWKAVTENKWLSSVYLKQNDIPIPQSKAVFDRGVQLYPDVPKLQNGEDLMRFFQSDVDGPVFAKPIGGMWSAGAFRISGHTETHVTIDGKGEMTYADLAEKAIGKRPYLFQDCLRPHAFFDGLTDAIATVRCVNVIHNDRLTVPHTLLKLPQMGNIADNFWRAGNVLCDLDPETGTVRGLVISKNGRRQALDALPENDRTLIGEALPHWQELKALNERVALLHSANRFGSTDIALTQTGPVIVEVNNGCAFELVQMATGQGLLDQPMLAFFRDCGVKI